MSDELTPGRLLLDALHRFSREHPSPPLYEDLELWYDARLEYAAQAVIANAVKEREGKLETLARELVIALSNRVKLDQAALSGPVDAYYISAVNAQIKAALTRAAEAGIEGEK